MLTITNADNYAQAQAAYRELLVEARVTTATTWGGFQADHKLDARFKVRPEWQR
jgi:hypothetical protein